MNQPTQTRAINAAAGVIHAAMQQGWILSTSIAYALDAAGLLNSPEHAAEVEQLRTATAGLRQGSERWAARCDHIAKQGLRWKAEADGRKAHGERLKAELERLRARVAELETECVALQNDKEHVLRAAERRMARLEAAAGDGATRSVDEDPIAHSLTVEALHASSGAVIETPSRREQSTAKLRGILARQQAAVEAPHETPPRPRPTPHDLPEVTA